MPTWAAVLLGLLLGAACVGWALIANYERAMPRACGKCAYWEAGEYGGEPPEHRCKEGRDVHLRRWHRR